MVGDRMDPRFLLRDQVDRAHDASLTIHGGLPGLRSEHALESALAAPRNDFYYASVDLYGIAAAYAFHIAEAQAFVDGNKRTAIIAAFLFLEENGVDTEVADAGSLYEDLDAIANRRMTKADLAMRFRSLFAAPDRDLR